MVACLEQSHHEMNIKIEKLVASGPVLPPGIAPGLAPNVDMLATKIRQMQNTVEDIGKKFPVIEEFVKLAGPRIGDAEIKQSFTTGAVQELQGAMTAMRMEVQQVVQQQAGSAAAAAPAAAAATVGTAATAPYSTAFDPWASAAFGQQPAAPQQQQQQQQQQPPQHATYGTYNIGSPGIDDTYGKPKGDWKLFDEKYITLPALTSNKYDSKHPMEWLQGLKDYVAGRCEELDALLNWTEVQTESIDVELVGASDCCPMLNRAPSLREVSRQLWAMLNPLVKDTTVADVFANVPRHNGLEAWRQLSEPVIEDKELLQKDLLPVVTNPKGASNMEGVVQAVLDWDTNIRLCKKA